MRRERGKNWPAAMLVIVVLSACAVREGVPPDWDINVPVTASYVRWPTPFTGTIQVIAYNIERGFHWQEVAEYIEARRAEIPATIVLLSECDRHHSRTGEVFVAEELARVLGLEMAFITEYVEYNDQTPENQGDHGNAILSPFPLSHLSVIRHTSIYSWQKRGWLQGQPRYGERVTLGADVSLPDGRKLRLYTAHLESNGEMVGKWIQMREILHDAEGREVPVVIGGDFNEVPGGLMFSLIPFYGMKNAFSGDISPTGGCRAVAGQARCLLKIDWILYRGLSLVERRVDYPLTAAGEVLSDHAPVRAVFVFE